jgi:Rad3-related DNA helicase
MRPAARAGKADQPQFGKLEKELAKAAVFDPKNELHDAATHTWDCASPKECPHCAMWAILPAVDKARIEDEQNMLRDKLSMALKEKPPLNKP